MFCGNCGANIPDGSGFCPNCGTALGAEPVAPIAPETPIAPEVPIAPEAPIVQEQAPVYQANPIASVAQEKVNKLKGMGKEKLTKIGIIVGAIIVVIILISVGSSGLGGGAPCGDAKKLVKAEYSVDGAETVFKYVMQCEIDAQIKADDKSGDEIEDMDDLIKSYNKELKDENDDIKDFKIKSATKLSLDKKFKNNAIENISKYYDLKYDKKVDAKDLAQVSVEYTYTDDDGNEVLDRDTLLMFKYEGKWYLINSYYISDSYIKQLKTQDSYDY